tara:strand:+ start:660 stop:2054 length:1395 start_codon:yes stop_codon:yes gene_type:complete
MPNINTNTDSKIFLLNTYLKKTQSPSLYQPIFDEHGNRYQFQPPKNEQSFNDGKIKRGSYYPLKSKDLFSSDVTKIRCTRDNEKYVVYYQKDNKQHLLMLEERKHPEKIKVLKDEILSTFKTKNFGAKLTIEGVKGEVKANKILGVGREQYHTYLAKDIEHVVTQQTYYQGKDLLDCLAEEDKTKKLSFQEKLEIIASAAKELMLYQEKALLHRDIKLDNIICLDSTNKEKSAKIIDNGYAVSREESDYVDSALFGSFGYMAPEFFPFQNRQFNYNEKTEVYALSIVALLLLSPSALNWYCYVINNRVDSYPRFIDFTGVVDIDTVNPVAKVLKNDLKAFLKQMINKTPAERPTFQEISEKFSNFVKIASVINELDAYIEEKPQSARARISMFDSPTVTRKANNFVSAAKELRQAIQEHREINMAGIDGDAFQEEKFKKIYDACCMHMSFLTTTRVQTSKNFAK